jgi:hypothetical protein
VAVRSRSAIPWWSCQLGFCSLLSLGPGTARSSPPPTAFLIEYSRQRAPLSIAAIGTGIAELIIVIGAGRHHHWHVVVGSLIGTLGAVVVYAFLRINDPDASDPRGHGRSALLVAGSWLGGLGLGPTAVGGGFWIATYFICLVGTWLLTRQNAEFEYSSSIERVPPVFVTPLVSALAVALAASLIAGS